MLGLTWVISHPGNCIGDREAGTASNASAIAEVLTVTLMRSGGSGTMTDPRFATVLKLLEMPEENDEFGNDRRMLVLLRSMTSN